MLSTGQAGARESGLDAAVRLVGEGEFQAALSAARGETRSLERAQALLHVFHQAGALEEALEAGRKGLEDHPADPWLLDRCAYLALSLGAGDLARGYSVRLGADADPESSSARSASWMLVEIERLQENRRNEQRALRRARWTVFCAALLCVAAALRMAMGGIGTGRKSAG